jgi:chromosome partitioning protein
MSGSAHVIVLGNEKGGSGKSTTAVHIGVALAHAGFRTAMLDLDTRQRTVTRYLENRAAFAARREITLPTPDVAVIGGSLDELALRFAQALPAVDFLIVDTPGSDSPAAQAALARADTIVTPMNDSFVDFDLIGQVDPDTYEVKKPSFFAEVIWDARRRRASTAGSSVDWVVLRNRLSTLEARNRKRVGEALDQLAKRIGFRVIGGLSERVVYRELFPRGLTLLDRAYLDDFSLSHVGARSELRALIGGLNLPGWSVDKLAA